MNALAGSGVPEIEHEHFLESVASMTERRDRESLEESLVGTMYELVPAGGIALYTLHDQEVRLVARADKHGVASGERLDRAGHSMLLDQSREFRKCLDSQQAVPLRSGDSGGFLYPIVVEEHVVGFLSVICDNERHCDLRLVSGLIRIYQNFLTILSESEHDKLTGLLNRKTFDDRVIKILQSNRELPDETIAADARRPQRKNVSNWLAMLDIDHFKRINDTFGHLYGDEVLLLLSRIMKKTFRSSDFLFRYGGEEFIVVLIAQEAENAYLTLERFRKAVESFNFPQVGKVTVSIGFVDMGDRYVPATVVGHADQALYYAKHHGRNRIFSYDELIAAKKLDSELVSSDVELF